MYRFVRCGSTDDPSFRNQFLSDRENGMEPRFRREKQYPELFDGMSMYASLDGALRVWRRCRDIAAEKGEPMQIGQFVAELELLPGCDFSIEDLGDEDQHLTIWGDPDHLSAATRRIYTPTSDAE